MAKTTPSKPRPLTDEEKKIQIERFLASKREQFFQIALSNFAKATDDPKRAVDLSIELADYALERLYKPDGGEDGR